MNLANISFCNQYLYSPIIWIHHIQTDHKIYLIFISLIVIPCTNYIYIMTSCLIYTYILFYSNINYDFMIDMIKLLFSYLLVFIMILMFHKVSYNNSKNFFYITIYKPINILIKFNLKQIIIQYNFYLIPEYLIRIISFIYINFLLLKILFLTTKYENILLLYLYFINKIIKIRSIFYNKFIFTSSLASQFIEFIMQNYYYTAISIKVRKIHVKENKFTLYIFFITSWILKTLHDIDQISFILYSREIIIENFYLINI